MAYSPEGEYAIYAKDLKTGKDFMKRLRYNVVAYINYH